MADEWIKIERNTELHVGDIVELDFVLISLFDWNLWYAVQLAAIEKRIEADPRFTLLSHTYPEEKVVTFKVKVNKNPVTVAAIIVLIVVASVGIWISFDKGRLFLREVAVSGKEIGWTSIQVGASVLAVVLGLTLLKKAK